MTYIDKHFIPLKVKIKDRLHVNEDELNDIVN